MDDITKRMLNNMDRIIDIIENINKRITTLEKRVFKLENANNKG